MAQRSEIMEVADVRGLVNRLIQEQPASIAAIEAARSSMQQIFEQAAEHGLTAAEVVKAVLQPAFERKRGCDCPSCNTRRAGSMESPVWRNTQRAVGVVDR